MFVKYVFLLGLFPYFLKESEPWMPWLVIVVINPVTVIIGNPGLTHVQLAAVASIAHQYSARVTFHLDTKQCLFTYQLKIPEATLDRMFLEKKTITFLL